MSDVRQRDFRDRALVRLAVCFTMGLAVGVGGTIASPGVSAVILGWVVAAFTFVVWTVAQIWRMSSSQTSAHATAEDAGRVMVDLLLVVASVASLVGVALLLIAGGAQGRNGGLHALLGVASVAASWALVHTLFALRYARMFYIDDHGGINFNDDANRSPSYSDFVYVAFTIGMTYQVSDTVFTRPDFRRIALRQSLLAYLFGSVILAATINLVVQLAGSGS